MKIKSIEPTPSPNTMKIILNEELPSGTRANYKKEDTEGAPQLIQNLLQIEGVKGVYHVADFLAIERNAKFNWQGILNEVRSVFGESASTEGNENTSLQDHYGEVQVAIQFFKSIPMQVKLTDGEQEKRYSLGARFLKAIEKAQELGENVVLERKWKDSGIRYGDFDQIGEQIIEELEAAYPNERLEALLNVTPIDQRIDGEEKAVSLDDFSVDDWRERYRILEQLKSISLSDLPLLEVALKDEKPSIRRLAVVYLGMIEDRKVLPLLYLALQDKTVTVRRTAGDCLSDLGFNEATPAMCLALEDASKLVRWRAAMFLYEVGDESALPALRKAEGDSEFEVEMQIKMAIERIEEGEEAKGSVWKQMTDARKK
ncbi:conserved virulence factor C family protein [Bacillus spongiae]|uniref:Conserved virulence factor C family protein n=1 Tax=Bacillus spongiae TaxID=2683610 RepID=A0ABU8HD42_9BACI